MIEFSSTLGGENVDEQKTGTMIYSIIIELFNLIRGIGFVLWYFYSNHMIKQRKVTVMQKLTKIFYPMITLYFSLFLIEIIAGVIEIFKITYI